MSATDRDDAVKAIRTALKAATGRAWSVRGGTGTAWGWITVSAPPARRVDDETTEADARELMRVLGTPGQFGGLWQNFRTVDIDPKERAACVERAQAAAELRRVARNVGGPRGDAARAELAASPEPAAEVSADARPVDTTDSRGRTIYADGTEVYVYGQQGSTGVTVGAQLPFGGVFDDRDLRNLVRLPDGAVRPMRCVARLSDACQAWHVVDDAGHIIAGGPGICDPSRERAEQLAAELGGTVILGIPGEPAPDVSPEPTCPEVDPGSDTRCELAPHDTGACVAEAPDGLHVWPSRPARPLAPSPRLLAAREAAAELSSLALGICRHCGIVQPIADLMNSEPVMCAEIDECFASADARHAVRPETEWTARGRLAGVLTDVLTTAWLEHDRSPAAHVSALAAFGAVRPRHAADAAACLAEWLRDHPRCDGPGYLAQALVDADLVQDIARDAVVRHVAVGIVQELRAGATLERAVRRPIASGEVYAAAVVAGGSVGWSVWPCALAAAEVLVDRATTGLPYVHLRAGHLATAYPGHESRGRHVSVDADGAVWVLAPHATAWVRA